MEITSGVSIHLMLLLILKLLQVKGEDGGFNTSHVTINQRKETERNFYNWCFNTSHVTINHVGGRAGAYAGQQFQYISCYY